MQWEPIQTAPKDGTEILAADFDGRHDTSFNVVWWFMNGWTVNAPGDNYASPTHWMQIPPLTQLPLKSHPSKAVEMLNALPAGESPAMAHMDAEEILCNFLRDQGFSEVADAFEEARARCNFCKKLQMELLDIICGRGEYAALGNGIHTYPGLDKNQNNIHAGCEELERQGLVKRQINEPGHCFFVEA